MFGNGIKAKEKRERDVPKLKATMQQLTEEIESAENNEEMNIGKSGPVVVDFSEFPVEDYEENSYVIIKRD